MVVLADTNPVNVTLSREVRTIKEISLVYFKLQGFDVQSPPYNLWLKVDGISCLGSDLVVTSNNKQSTANTFQPKNSSTVPLYTKMGTPYINNFGTEVQYQVLHGKQPKGMRWRAKDVSDITNFTITVLNDNNVPLAMTPGGKMEFVFEVEWLPSELQSQLWKTDTVYMNSMNA